MTPPTTNAPPGPTTSVSASTGVSVAAQWQAAATGAPTSVGYSPDLFYCKATDTKGHGEKVGGRVPPDIYAQIQQIVHDDNFPDYTMPMDFIRDAIVHHLHRRQDQAGTMRMREVTKEIIERLGYEELVAKHEDELQRWTNIVERQRATLIGLARENAWHQIGANLDAAEEHADPIAEPWRSKLLDLVKEWRQKVPDEFRDGEASSASPRAIPIPSTIQLLDAKGAPLSVNGSTSRVNGPPPGGN